MKIGCFQFDVLRNDVEANISKITTAIETSGADLLVMPELALSGYLLPSEEAFLPLSQTLDSAVWDPIQYSVNKADCAAVIGFSEKTEEGLFNSAILIIPGPDNAESARHCYRKVHLFSGEKDIFLPGNQGFPVIEYRGVKIGMAVCFDHFFPESARTLAVKGVQIVCHPSNLVLPGKAQISSRCRAFENRVFWILSNRTGTESLYGRSITYTGQSQIVNPEGEVLADAPESGEILLIADIDPGEAANKLVDGRNHLLSDRRPDQYR